MSSLAEDIVMRFLSKTETRTLTLYSDAHRARLEAAGLFPKRVRLGTGRYCRVGYVESEVLEWMQVQISKRDKAHTSR
jgi:prophage regulatory protein